MIPDGTMLGSDLSDLASLCQTSCPQMSRDFDPRQAIKEFEDQYHVGITHNFKEIGMRGRQEFRCTYFLGTAELGCSE